MGQKKISQMECAWFASLAFNILPGFDLSQRIEVAVFSYFPCFNKSTLAQRLEVNKTTTKVSTTPRKQHFEALKTSF